MRYAQQEAYGATRGISIPRLMRQDEDSGEHYKQFFRDLLPQRIIGISDRTLGIVQRWLDMVDWRMSKVRSCSSKQRSNITHYFGKLISAKVKEGHPAGRWVEGQERREEQGTYNEAPLETRDGTAKLEEAANLEAEDQRTEAIERVVNELNPGQRPIQSIRCLARVLWMLGSCAVGKKGERRGERPDGTGHRTPITTGVEQGREDRRPRRGERKDKC